MSVPRLTASRFRLAVLCSHWTTLDAPESPPSKYAAKGTALHALVEGAPDSAEKISALDASDADDVARWFSAWSESPFSKVPWRNEIALAWHPSDTARELPTDGPRDYRAAAPDELVGTADLLHIVGGHGWVADLKTGFQRDAEPVAEHSQLRALALFAARAFMLEAVTIQLLHLGDSGLTATEYTLDAAELDRVAEHLRGVVEAGPSEPRPGAHCARLWCPASAVCPSTQALVKAAAPEVAFTLREPTNDAEALRLRDGAERLEAIADAASRLAKEYADKHGGIAIGDMKVWKATSQEVIAVSRPGFGEFSGHLHELGLDDAIEVETKRSCSRASIERAIKAKNPSWGPAKIRETSAAIMEVARRCDAVGEKPGGHREVRGRPTLPGATT